MVGSEVLVGAERRRRWSYSDKVRIVEESFAAGVTVAAVARRNGVATSLVFAWRDQAKSGRLGGSGVAPMLVPVTISANDRVPHQDLAVHNMAVHTLPLAASRVSASVISPAQEPAKPPRRRVGLIEIELGAGQRLKVDRDVDAKALARVLEVLAKSAAAQR